MTVIAAFIEPGSIIFSDGWLRHREEDLVIDLNMHMHYWINHSDGIYSEDITDPLLGNNK